MKKKELEFFRKMLKQQLEELTQRSDATIAGLLNSTVNSADPLDRRMSWKNTGCTGQVIGTLRVYTAAPWEFTIDDVNLVQAVAQIAGMALDMARLSKGYKSSF